jgi:hypothetical protein
VLLSLWRIVAREPLTQAISGVVGHRDSARLIASRTGNATRRVRAEPAQELRPRAVVCAISCARPLADRRIVVGPVTGEMLAWRQRPAAARGLPARDLDLGRDVRVRLAVQFPLWLADQTVLLGTLNAFVLGLPLFGLAVWLSWVVLRRVPPRSRPRRRARRAGGNVSAGTAGEDLLQGLLALRHRDEDQLVVSLERVVPAGRDRAARRG